MKRRFVSIGGWCGASQILGRMGLAGLNRLSPFDLARSTLDGVLHLSSLSVASKDFFPPWSSITQSFAVVPLSKWVFFRAPHTAFTHFDLNQGPILKTMKEALWQWRLLVNVKIPPFSDCSISPGNVLTGAARVNAADASDATWENCGPDFEEEQRWRKEKGQRDVVLQDLILVRVCTAEDANAEVGLIQLLLKLWRGEGEGPRVVLLIHDQPPPVPLEGYHEFVAKRLSVSSSGSKKWSCDSATVLGWVGSNAVAFGVHEDGAARLDASLLDRYGKGYESALEAVQHDSFWALGKEEKDAQLLTQLLPKRAPAAAQQLSLVDGASPFLNTCGGVGSTAWWKAYYSLSEPKPQHRSATLEAQSSFLGWDCPFCQKSDSHAILEPTQWDSQRSWSVAEQQFLAMLKAQKTMDEVQMVETAANALQRSAREVLGALGELKK